MPEGRLRVGFVPWEKHPPRSKNPGTGALGVRGTCGPFPGLLITWQERGGGGFSQKKHGMGFPRCGAFVSAAER